MHEAVTVIRQDGQRLGGGQGELASGGLQIHADSSGSCPYRGKINCPVDPRRTFQTAQYCL